MNRLNSTSGTASNRLSSSNSSTKRRKSAGGKHSVTAKLSSVDKEDQLFRQAAAFAPLAFGFFSNPLRQR